MVSFLFLFTWQKFRIAQILSGPKTFSTHFFCFLPILDREFSFFFLSPIFFSIGNFLFLLFADSFDREFSPFCFLLRVRFMVSWDFGSRLVERMDMIYVRVLVWPVV